MKIYLDDIREPPDGWLHVRWPYEALRLLRTGDVTEISLDHDLGDDSRGTGYDVLEWIAAQVVANALVPPVIESHTENLMARQKMEAAKKRIHRLAKENEEQGRKWNGSVELSPPYA